MKKRGRPRLCDERGARFSVSLPESLYLQLRQLAEEKDLSVASVTRAAIRRLVVIHHKNDNTTI